MKKPFILALTGLFIFSMIGFAADESDTTAFGKKIDAPPVVNPTATPVLPTKLTAIDKDELLGHIKFLSSPEFGGREAGTPQQVEAAIYIANEFARYGMQPFGDDKDGARGFLQEFPIKVFKGAGKDAAFKFSVRDVETVGEMEKHFVLIPAGYKPVKAAGAVAFAGYGIANPDINYDDFANVDLAGKWALILRYHPQEFNEKGAFKVNPSKHAALAEKVLKCSLRRAVGVMIVTGPEGREKETDSDLLGKSIGSIIGDFTIPVVHINQNVANQLLASSGKTIGQLQAAINNDLTNQSMLLPDVKVSAVSDIEVITKQTFNVIGRLEGSDALLKKEHVVIGAHCDHVGMGAEGSLLGKEGIGKLHPGADDNASGTSGLLEIAQHICALKDENRPKRSIIFMGFSGEEKGLLGSVFYCEKPRIPLTDTVAMLNLDMIGRSSDGGAQVAGIGSSKIFRELVTRNAVDSKLKLHLGSAADGPSDHASFFRKSIPVLFFYTGTHADYHRPTDTWEKINAPIAAETATLALKVLLELTNRPDRPPYSQPGANSYLGVGADDSKKDVAGFAVGEVAPDSPAGLAGIKRGDLLTALNDQTLSIPMDLHLALTEYSAGDNIVLDLKRGEEKMRIKLTLGARKPKKK